MIELVKKKTGDKKGMRDAVEGLLDELLAVDTTSGMGCDNMTAILITLK